MSPIALAFTGPRRVEVVEEAARTPSDREVLLRTVYSGISAGTELTAYRGSNPYLQKRWDETRRLFIEDEHQTIDYPVVGWGYEEVGEVVDVGREAEPLPPGTLVYGTWGHRSETVMDVEEARVRMLPASLVTVVGAFSHIGSIALNGILDAALRPGETLAIFGLGVVGQIVAQLARLAGARVVGVDVLPNRLDIARRMGTQDVIDASASRAGEAIKDMTGGRGADVCIEASGSTIALGEAIRACAYSSRVVALGFYQGESRGLYLGEEFHHNRITIVCSQISGTAPEMQHRWNRVRLAQTFMGMVERGEVQVEPLITHIVPAARAGELFELLDRQPGEALQAVLDFREVGTVSPDC